MEESDAGSSSGESIELKNPETLDSDYEYKVEDEEEIEEKRNCRRRRRRRK